jgi:carbohydrate-binding DOMON domain-containing protein
MSVMYNLFGGGTQSSVFSPPWTPRINPSAAGGLLDTREEALTSKEESLAKKEAARAEAEAKMKK